MCGIFGFTVQEKSRVDPKVLRSVLGSLVKLSESRGKEAAGLALISNQGIDVCKDASRGIEFMKHKTYRELTKKVISNNRISESHVGVIGHTRLVTNGSMEMHENNQPVIRDGIVGIHNGIIVNDAEIFQKYGLKRNSEVDTEVLLALIKLFNKDSSLANAISRAFREIYGTASVALLFNDEPVLALASNNGSLYQVKTNFGHVFASERYILQEVIKKYGELLGVRGKDIIHIHSNSGLLINLEDGVGTSFDFSRPIGDVYNKTLLPINDIKTSEIKPTPSFQNHLEEETLEKYLQIYNENCERISKLKRCARCILPETMPFVRFDEEGICNFCRRHVKYIRRSERELLDQADQIRGDGTRPDCIFPLSGGRDSSYGLHYVKNVLKLNPIAYSYDWGMLTDLGRRNQARMCGKLGIEHLWVSADIIQKRKNIQQNVLAWMKKPDLGTIPIFMAGDKQYFHYLNRLKNQVNVDLSIYCENPVEQTNFKYGFCGIAPKFDLEHVYNLGIGKKLALAFYYAKQFIRNPALINSSLIDTAGAYLSTYFLSHDYIFLYNYVLWDERIISETLIKEYDWELAPDTSTTWRIGDGTAPFYNYIYYTVAGFTENDTFRSNQIREGMMTRDRAIVLVDEENKPRFESIRWYCDTIGLDMKKMIDTINAIPKLY